MAGPTAATAARAATSIFEAVPGLNTLIDFRYTQHFRAPRGKGGSGSNRTGAGGDDLVIKVPVGTQVLADDEDRTLLADLTEVGQRVILLKGGDGGRGNASYKTSTNRAPRQHRHRLAGRGDVGVAAAQAARRRRPGRPSQRRQVDLPQLDHQRRRQGRRLSVHDAPARSSASSATRAASSSSPTSPG